MLRLGLGTLLGIALATVAGWLWLNHTDPCWGRCGPTTKCVDRRCDAAPSTAAALVKTPPRRRGKHAGSSSAAIGAQPEVTLKPGDDRMISDGDALGRAEHIDMTRPGDDGRERTQEELDQAFSSAQPGIGRCIGDAIGDAPLDSGKVEVGLRVGKSGKVERVRVEAPALLVHNGLLLCVRSVVAGVHFAAAGGADVVTWPFNIQ